ncbi:hypothetical protein CARUB_v10011248mg, partial [Capsella rubella]
MANLTLYLNIHSASHLGNVNLFTKMDVYAKISIHGENTRKKQKAKTIADRSGGSNPTWNQAVKFSVNERSAHNGRLTLVMRLISRRVLGNKEIGRVNIPLAELLNSNAPSIDDGGSNQEMKLIRHQVKTLSGKHSGYMTFLYRFKPNNVPAGVLRYPFVVESNDGSFSLPHAVALEQANPAYDQTPPPSPSRTPPPSPTLSFEYSMLAGVPTFLRHYFVVGSQ